MASTSAELSRVVLGCLLEVHGRDVGLLAEVLRNWLEAVQVAFVKARLRIEACCPKVSLGRAHLLLLGNVQMVAG